MILLFVISFNPDAETRTNVLFAFHSDFAFHGFCQALADVKTKTNALDETAFLDKRAEHLFLFFACDAYACVLYEHFADVLAEMVAPSDSDSALGSKLDSVGDVLVDDVVKAVFIYFDVDIRTTGAKIKLYVLWNLILVLTV